MPRPTAGPDPGVPRETPAESLVVTPIGFVRSPWTTKVEAPRQPAAAHDVAGIIELLPGKDLEHAIEDLGSWSRIWVISWFDRNRGWRPKVLPPRAARRKGVLATRSPHRPNPLGLSVLRLQRVDGLHLHVRDVDLLDGTPVLDIKPYVAYTDAHPDAGAGWLPADPRPEWAVTFAGLAQQQLDWLDARLNWDLRGKIGIALALGPQPHPYRRIRPGQAGTMQLAVRDWRVDFTVTERHIEVLRVRSGYRPAQLRGSGAATGSAAALGVHHEFVEAFPP